MRFLAEPVLSVSEGLRMTKPYFVIHGKKEVVWSKKFGQFQLMKVHAKKIFERGEKDDLGKDGGNRRKYFRTVD